MSLKLYSEPTPKTLWIATRAFFDKKTLWIATREVLSVDQQHGLGWLGLVSVVLLPLRYRLCVMGHSRIKSYITEGGLGKCIIYIILRYYLGILMQNVCILCINILIEMGIGGENDNLEFVALVSLAPLQPITVSKLYNYTYP